MTDSMRERLAYRLWFLVLYGLTDETELGETPRRIFKAYWDTDDYFREKWGRHADAILDELSEPTEAMKAVIYDYMGAEYGEEIWRSVLDAAKEKP